MEVSGALPKKETLALITVKRVCNSETRDENLTVTARGENFYSTTVK